MKKAVIYGKNDLRIEETEIPEMSNGKVLVKVRYCGICGSDLHWLGGTVPVTVPYFPGHEFTGTVEKVGRGVTEFKVGDRVVCIPMANPCGKCYFCREGMDTYCINRNRQDLGGFGEYVLVEERQIYHLPEDVSFKVGTLVEPLSVVVHAMDYAGLKVGDTVLILGGGPIGLLLLSLARYTGAGKVILSEPENRRRRMAKEFGADIVINPNSEKVSEAINTQTNGVGVDIAFEAVGRIETCEEAVRCVRKGGKVMFVGLVPPERKMQLSPFEVFSKELMIRGVGINFHTYGKAIRILGRLNLELLITHEFGLPDLQEGMACCQRREALKALISCESPGISRK
jgi:L-iditol 2-dehydrogenase